MIEDSAKKMTFIKILPNKVGNNRRKNDLFNPIPTSPQADCVFFLTKATLQKVFIGNKKSCFLLESKKSQSIPVNNSVRPYRSFICNLYQNRSRTGLSGVLASFLFQRKNDRALLPRPTV